MRFGTLNLASGRSMLDGGTDPERLTAAVGSLDADVLAVQEVDVGQVRSAGADQLALVGEALGAGHRRFVATLHGTPGPRRGWRPAGDANLPDVDCSLIDLTNHPAATGSSYGVGLVSRVPVREWRTLRFPAARGWLPVVVPEPGRRRPRVLWVPDEPRAAVAAVLDSPRMTVVSTHLSFVPGANVRQLRRLCRWLEDLPSPRLLLGDLNLPGRLPARVTGWSALVRAPTYPSAVPRVQLDHVLGSGTDLDAVTGWDVRPLPVSDHRAVLVDLDL